jgi:hypothetical protein
MQVTAGTVIRENIVVEDCFITEDSTVTVRAHKPAEPPELAPEDEDELCAAMTEIKRGEFVLADELLESLAKYV